HLAASAEQASQRKLDFRCIPVGLSHAREDLGRMIETVVDQVVEANVIVPWQSHGARGAITAAQYPGGNADEDERQRQHDRWQLSHAPREDTTPAPDGSVLAGIPPLAQVFPRLEVRHVLAGERDRLARLRIASLARRPEVQREATKPPDLDALSLGERIAHDFQ